MLKRGSERLDRDRILRGRGENGSRIRPLIPSVYHNYLRGLITSTRNQSVSSRKWPGNLAISLRIVKKKRKTKKKDKEKKEKHHERNYSRRLEFTENMSFADECARDQRTVTQGSSQNRRMKWSFIFLFLSLRLDRINICQLFRFLSIQIENLV